MKSNDFVKYLTVQIVEQLGKPKDKTPKTKNKSSLSTHWFGIIPLSLKMLYKRFSKNI